MALPDPIYNPKPNLGGDTTALGTKLSDPSFQQAAINKATASQPKPKDPIETLILFFVKTTATLQTNTYKILWGSATNPPKRTVTTDPKTGKYIISGGATTLKITNFFQSGLFNILDTINGLDLCNILSFITTTTNSKAKKRPPKPWTDTEAALYFVQDQAKLAQDTIDKYLALPTTLITSYIGVEPKTTTPQQAVTASGAPQGTANLTGTNVQKYNVYSLLQALKDAFTVNGQKSIITPEDATLLSQVPGFGGSLNFIDDFIGLANQYTDYRNISNDDLQKLIKKINDVRSVCVTIQTFDFASTAALVGNFLGVDVRAQIQRLSKVIDPTQLLPTLKQISNTVNSFVKIAQRTFNILSQLQFIIKLAILLTKIFTFIEIFFTANPLPTLFTTSGVQASFNKAREAATNGKNQVIRRLEQVNGLLTVLVSFIRYLLANSIELLTKLQVLIGELEACETTKDSAVLLDLKASYKDLKQIQEQLGTYIAIYDGKTDPNSATFAQYSIRVVDEELTDKSIQNKRRRGIAVDQSGTIVAQSDLTFATNTSIIIQEVQVKLVSLGLVAPQFSSFAGSDLAVVTTSINYLENDTSLNSDFNFNDLLKENPDVPDSTGDSAGIGLNAFVDNLPGGKKLRTRSKTAMQNSATAFQSQVDQAKIDGNNALTAPNVAYTVGVETGNQNNKTPQNNNPNGSLLR